MLKYKLLFIFFILFLIAGIISMAKCEETTQDREQSLTDYLKNNWKSPEDYVIDKFSDHDILIIGEMHRTKHDVELIHNLIPRLYEAGVYNLGMEFGSYEYQDEVDRLITGDTYDEDLARWIMFKDDATWGYIEYIDIYKVAWELNRSLPEDAPKFRVINLRYRPAWETVTEEEWETGDRKEILKRIWNGEDYDKYMADTVLKEVIEKGQKALIYAGMHHAFTRYGQPVYDCEGGEITFYRFLEERMGQLLYKELKDRVFCIALHYPWASKLDRNKFSECSYPVGGVIDRVMEKFEDKRVGFDVPGMPFGELTDEYSMYSVGYSPLTLADFCDGYIFLNHFKDYEGCTVDEQFITKENLEEAILSLPPDSRQDFTTPQDFIESMKSCADFKSRYPHLK